MSALLHTSSVHSLLLRARNSRARRKRSWPQSRSHPVTSTKLGSLPASSLKYARKSYCAAALSPACQTSNATRAIATTVSPIVRVESRTGASGVSLPVAHDAAFARVASVRLGLALFPVPAHRTEQARFAHSALVESVTRSPTESWSSAYSAERAQGSDVVRLPDTFWSPAIGACAWHTATGAAVDEHVDL
jgi:hypothetical protein